MITDYYTSTRFSPVKSTARASQTGHATNIIQGLAQGYQATAPPAIVIALGIFGAWKLPAAAPGHLRHRRRGHGAAVADCGLIVALDAFGPITDNAGGIAEMAELPEEVRNVTDKLDAVGNTTKAVTKGYAIGSAALAALVLFNAFEHELAGQGQAPDFAIGNPAGADRPADRRHDGLPVRRAGRWRRSAAPAAPWSRRSAASSGRSRGSWRAPSCPSTAPASSLVTKAAQREMILPALIPIVITVIVGLISIEALGGLLIGVIVVGVFVAISMTAGGGAWDNAKKLIEDGAFGGKGSEAHAAAVTGDTVGDPYKDTAGPAINPMIKVANIVALLIIPLIT